MEGGGAAAFEATAVVGCGGHEVDATRREVSEGTERECESYSLVSVDGDGTRMTTERHGKLSLDVEALVGRGEVRSRLVLGLRWFRKALEDGCCRSRRSAKPSLAQ